MKLGLISFFLISIIGGIVSITLIPPKNDNPIFSKEELVFYKDFFDKSYKACSTRTDLPDAEKFSCEGKGRMKKRYTEYLEKI